MKTFVFFFFHDATKFGGWFGLNRAVKVEEKFYRVRDARHRAKQLMKFYGYDSYRMFVGSKISFC